MCYDKYMGMNDDVELVICNYPNKLLLFLLLFFLVFFLVLTFSVLKLNTSIIKYAQCIFIDIYFADLKKDWQNGWKS